MFSSLTFYDYSAYIIFEEKYEQIIQNEFVIKLIIHIWPWLEANLKTRNAVKLLISCLALSDFSKCDC